MDIWHVRPWDSSVEVLQPPLEDRPVYDQPEPPTVGQAQNLYTDSQLDETEYEALVETALTVHGDEDIPQAIDDRGEADQSTPSSRIGSRRAIATGVLSVCMAAVAVTGGPEIIGAIAGIVLGWLWATPAMTVWRNI